jgi:hypothetical protein
MRTCLGTLFVVGIALGAGARHAAGADVERVLGDLPPGETLTITIEATIDDPLPAGTNEVTNQGLVSGDNFADVPTDDPDTAAPDDPTVTPVVTLILDSDGDGIPDDRDACPASDTSETIVIDGCDSGVENPLGADGCTASDRIDALARGARNHGKFVSGVSKLVKQLFKSGAVTRGNRGAVQRCAAHSRIR